MPNTDDEIEVEDMVFHKFLSFGPKMFVTSISPKNKNANFREATCTWFDKNNSFQYTTFSPKHLVKCVKPESSVSDLKEPLFKPEPSNIL